MEGPVAMDVQIKPQDGVETAQTKLTDGLNLPRKMQRIATFWEIFALGIVLTVGGIHIAWNGALSSGFAETVVVFVVVSIGFLCLILCSSEMTGLLPFSGGSYGFSRVNSLFFTKFAFFY